MGELPRGLTDDYVYLVAITLNGFEAMFVRIGVRLRPGEADGIAPDIRPLQFVV
jgi:hypothetical protein